jgi:hypothetical protein
LRGGRQDRRTLAVIWGGFTRLTQMGFPPGYPLVQIPNLPLIIGLAAWLLSRGIHGTDHSVALAVAYLAFAVWAYGELLDGVNLFRRLLGLGLLIAIALHLASLIRH